MATTDIYNDMDRQNLILAAQDRKAKEPPEEEPPITGGHSFGFQSGANKPGGTADRHLAVAVMNGKSLGEPTSFNAGAGAPTPIGVIRGSRETFATDTGGPQLQEFATHLEARQAFNRSRGEGEWRPPGQTLDEATAAANAKNPVYQAQAAELKRTTEAGTAATQAATAEKNAADFQIQWKNKYASPTLKSGGVGYDYTMPTDTNTIQDMLAAQEIAKTQGSEAGLKHYQESVRFRHHEPLFTPDNLQTSNLGFTADELNKLKQQNPTLYRRTIITLGPKLQQNGATAPSAKPWYEYAAEQHM